MALRPVLEPLGRAATGVLDSHPPPTMVPVVAVERVRLGVLGVARLVAPVALVQPHL